MPSKTAGVLEKFFPRGWLPRRWEEISRHVGENHIGFLLGHVSPELNMAPELKRGGQVESISEYESIVYHGISTKKGEGMKSYFEMMTAIAETGMVPGITLAGVQNLRTQYREAGGHEKYDMDNAALAVARFPDEKLAEAQLLSFQVVPTRGFTEMPIPGLEGAGIKTFGELLKSDYYKSALKSHLSEEQLKQLERVLPEIEKVSKQAKEQYEKEKVKTGAQYYQGKYQGSPAIFLRMDNPEFKRYSAPKPVTRKSKEMGGGGFDTYVKLPPRPKVVPPQYVEMLLAVQIGNFVISGSLLYTMSSLPPGDTFCHSLTKFQTKVETEEIDGKIYRTTHILPVNSTLAAESYLHREEVEGIFSSIFSRIESESG